MRQSTLRRRLASLAFRNRVVRNTRTALTREFGDDDAAGLRGFEARTTVALQAEFDIFFFLNDVNTGGLIWPANSEFGVFTLANAVNTRKCKLIS